MALAADAFDLTRTGANMSVGNKWAAGTRPTIVQAVSNMHNGSAVITTAATSSSNTMMLICYGGQNPTSGLTGWSTVQQAQPGVNWMGVFVMPAPSGQTSWTFGFNFSYQNGSCLLLEIAGSNIEFVTQQGLAASSGAVVTAGAWMSAAGLCILGIGGANGSYRSSQTINGAGTLLADCTTTAANNAPMAFYSLTTEGSVALTFNAATTSPSYLAVMVYPVGTTAEINTVASLSYGTASAAALRRFGTTLTYFEIQTDAKWPGGTLRCGIATPSLTTTTLIGADTNSCGYDSGGNVYINNTNIKTLASYSAGANIGVAINTVLGLIWFRVNGGNWNNDVIGNQNPVGNVGGISLATLASYGLLTAAFGVTTTGSAFLNTNSADLVYSAPTGFNSGAVYTPTTGGVQKAVDAHSYGALSGVFTSGGRFPSTLYGGVVYQPGYSQSPGAAGTAIGGTVQQAGSNVAKKVYLYDANNGQLLGSVTSNGSTGAFTIPALARTNVFAVALDPAYQALIYDQLTPL